jgi:carbonic anhydrase
MKKGRLRQLLVPAIALTISGSAQQHPAHWDYTDSLGPNHWGDLTTEFAECKVGHHQSPIDIRDARRADLPDIDFEYHPSPLDIVDNGHTIMINYRPGSVMSVGGKKYELKQFHFHIPSEEKIDGKGFDMSLHLVHSDAQGKIAVVAVLLQEGKDNPLVRELWSDLPKEKGTEKIFNNVEIDVSRILPADRGYYSFVGSLTTPPCTEDVTWFVLKNPVTISKAEIVQFSQVYRHNARPIQPVNDRIVLETR